MQDNQKQDNNLRAPGLNPDASIFQELRTGVLRATSLSTGLGARIGHFVFGQPLATSEEPLQRVPKAKALPVLASDNISSSAYATEAMTRILAIAGVGALSLALPITFSLIAILLIVVLSYSQVIRAYPTGGGSYTAAKQNLGTVPGLIAAASLLIDYVLTVAVSIAAGVEALTSVAPQLYPFRVQIDLLVILVLVLAHLRGVKETGTIFSIPTYCYVLGLLGLLAYGLFRLLTGTLPTYVPPPGWVPEVAQPVGFLLVLRAFSSGAVALTGVEAVANGMRIVKPPEIRNATIILLWMGGLFATLFLGISFLSSKIGLVPDPTEQETLISQLVQLLAGPGWLHLLIQVATASILLLAANTALVGFPRLSAVLAGDRFFPNQFLHRGSRLALSTGIVGVGTLAGAFAILFHGSVAALIPLYTVGVFFAFTMSQAGMVRYWRRERGPRWLISALLNGLGMIVTGVVAVEALTVKFTHGAWIVFVLIPLLVLMMLAINRHYRHLSQEIRLDRREALANGRRPSVVFVPVADLTKPVAAALEYARNLGPDVRAIHVTDDPVSAAQFRARWDRWTSDLRLVIIEAPYRNWSEALLTYLDSFSKQNPGIPLTVVIPEFIPRHWWEYLLHSQSAFRLKMALISRPNVIVVDVPYQLKE